MSLCNTMIEIRYAKLQEKDLLLRYDHHVRENLWEELIRNQRVILIFSDGEFAGWLRYHLFWDEIPFLSMLYLLEEYRGMGYGTQMIRFWEEEMQKLNYHQLMTSSQANESAQHFYRKLCYQDAGGFFPFCTDYEIIFTKQI